MSSALLDQQIKKRRIRLPALSRWHLLLPLPFIILAVALQFPLGASEGQGRVSLELPRGSELDRLLSGYILTEPITEKDVDLGAGVIDILRLSDYVIKKGDTLSGLSQRIGLSMDTIISFNGIEDARRLIPGTELSLPNKDGLKYYVQRGDSLARIAKRHGVPLNSLLDWNDLQSDLIKAGQLLFIPGARLSENALNRVLGRLFLMPALGRITSRFGPRSDPFTGVVKFHNGVDIANRVGTPVKASMAGRVSMVGTSFDWGRYVILSHAEGFQTLYAHLDKVFVTKGQRVAQHSSIAQMGDSGYSTGSHLHFTVFKNAVPINPERYLDSQR
jgi:murein DD-endopeptidase MepM/ murein hydrolase activator NlpD